MAQAVGRERGVPSSLRRQMRVQIFREGSLVFLGNVPNPCTLPHPDLQSHPLPTSCPKLLLPPLFLPLSGLPWIRASYPSPSVPASPQIAHLSTPNSAGHLTGLKVGGPSMACEVREKRHYTIISDKYLRHSYCSHVSRCWIIFTGDPTSTTPLPPVLATPPPDGHTAFQLTGRSLSGGR